MSIFTSVIYLYMKILLQFQIRHVITAFILVVTGGIAVYLWNAVNTVSLQIIILQGLVLVNTMSLYILGSKNGLSLRVKVLPTNHSALESETHSANENAVVKSLKVSKPIDTKSVFSELQLLLERESELLNRKSMHYTDFIICIQSIFPKKIELFDTITDPSLTIRGFFHPVMEDFISGVLQRSSSKPKIYLSQYRGGLHLRIEETSKGMTPSELKMFGNLLEQRTTGDTLGTFTSISILRSAGYQVCVKSVSGEGTSIDIYENGELEKIVFKSKHTKIFA